MKENVMREHYIEKFSRVDNFLLNPSLPYSLNIELNNSCNQKCVFCAFHGKYAQTCLKPGILEFEFVKQLLDQAMEKGIGKKELGFYLAGEPFLYSKLADVISYAKKLGFPYVFLTTNGVFAKPDKIKEVVDAGLDSIRFSVNASDKNMYKELHGTDDFNVVLENIKFLDKYKKDSGSNIAISLSCVLTKKTLGIQNEIKNIFSEYVDDILFAPVDLSRFENEHILKSEYGIEEYKSKEIDHSIICPVLFNNMYVNALGQIVPCCVAYDKDVYFADLYKDDDLTKAWYSKGYTEYRKIFLEGNSDSGTICENCFYRMYGVEGFVMD